MKIRKVEEAIRFREDKMAKVNLFETQRFFCDVYCLRPGQAQKVHEHADSDKIYYGLRGEGTVTLGSETHLLEAGTVVLAKAGEPHGVANDSSQDLVCLVFMAPHPDFTPS